MEAVRKQYTPEQKVAILREHLLERKPISDVCDRHGVHPTQFYAWQKQFFEQGAAAFARPQNPARRSREQERIRWLEEKLRSRDEVMAELLHEHMALKKSLGEI